MLEWPNVHGMKKAVNIWHFIMQIRKVSNRSPDYKENLHCMHADQKIGGILLCLVMFVCLMSTSTLVRTFWTMKNGDLKLTWNHIYWRHLFVYYIYYSGWMSCFILFVWDSPSFEGRQKRQNFKMKICTSPWGIEQLTPRFLTWCFRLYGHADNWQAVFLKYIALSWYMNKIAACRHVFSFWVSRLSFLTARQKPVQLTLSMTWSRVICA